MFARFLLAGVAVAFAAPPARNDQAPSSDAIVHEWGTFTTIAGEHGSAIDWAPLTGPEDLPCFVRRVRIPLFTKGYFARVRMETPVLYFYGKRPESFSVRVGFPHGMITEWYPDAAVKPKSIGPAGGSLADSKGSIVWDRVEMDPGANPALPEEKEANHYYAARGANAAAVRVNGQWERMLFYRGIGDFEAPVEARIVGEDQVEWRPNGFLRAPSGPVSKAILFENRGGRIGFQAFEPGTRPVSLRLPALDGDLEKLKALLEETLVKEGLFEKEAHAMVETWKDSWFEQGTRVFYIVPTKFVDAQLPIGIEPRPAELKRVFVGRMELLPPWIGRVASEALQADDAAALRGWGRLWGPIMGRFAGSWRATPGPAVRDFLSQARATAKACPAE